MDSERFAGRFFPLTGSVQLGLFPPGAEPRVERWFIWLELTVTVPVPVRPKRSGRYMSSTLACGST